MKLPPLSRRRFLLSGAAVAGSLIVGWGLLPPRQRMRAGAPLPLAEGEVALNGWITIAPDNTVGVVIPRAEMGQGVHTALAMLVAEELDVPLSSVRVLQAPNDKIYANLAVMRESLPFHPDDDGRLKPMAQHMLGKVARELGIVLTGGSSSVKDAWMPMREAGATARALLVTVAAREWKVPPEQVRTEDGYLFHDISQRRASYGSFAVMAAAASPHEVKLKEPHAFRLIGKGVHRLDSAAKSNGSAQFGIDARPEGMVYAALRMAPMFGGTIAGINPSEILDMPGVLSVIDFTNALEGQTGARGGVAVVARSYWQAKQAAAALPIRWEPGEHWNLSTDSIFSEFAEALDGDDGHAFHQVGDVEEASKGAMPITAEYRAPFLAHATMEPVNCTAQVKDGKVRLWLGTQVPSMAIDTAAKVGGVKAEHVELHECLLGGGFGRRLEVDMVAQAVAIARECQGRPVQVIWTREDDMTHDVYRPAALARFTASLDVAGNILYWDNRAASGALTPQFMRRNLGMPAAGPDKTTAEGLYDMPYEIPNQRISHVAVESAVPLGNWRSVGHSHNAFFKESFIDELAHAANRDPVAFRRSMLLRHPRHLTVLNSAIARAGKPGKGRAHGVALHESFGTIVAQVAEVSVEAKEIRVHKVVCAIDCGLVVNPNIVAQQIESSVIFGLSAALGGEITIKDGKVQQSNFGDYPVLRMNQAPHVETVVVLSAEPPEGVGEPAVPPVAPAVANAIFNLTGQRLRSLPLRLT
ncbi:xanthine dehydrogenase family protein molybdopterin-binding subunit [Massilia endophytica]|uniref:xanthine dehydrogenase family protein molybdopterin-binding subunit n=1 Tax=Massilia endophytica TaxID=2899220 RepID=UPI001E36709E|nr:xanthine dehydrogenase family protein molybdopterin-binding subunit [Massilia endophytica]UGQ48056.1 xanthine dehydrogenase family protein molybdopterin-binding subunit [Massilia endophytica]